MRPVHKTLLSALSDADSKRPVFLDTPATFQENVDDLGTRAASHFATHFGLELAIAPW
jgi:hypothetical protein